MKDMMIGVDLAKNVFQVHGALRTGEVQFRKKLTRKQFPAFMAKQEPCLVIFEACGSAHHWARPNTLARSSSVRRMMLRTPRQSLSRLGNPRCVSLNLKQSSSSRVQRCSGAGSDWSTNAPQI